MTVDRPSMTREAIEVRDVNNEITEYVDEDEAERQHTLKSKKHPKQKECRNTDRRTQKKRDRFAEIDQTLREISHDAMSHCGDHTLDETITRQVMDGTEALTTSGRLKLALGPLGKRKCKHCEAGWAQKQHTTGPVHKTPPKGPGTDISADVVVRGRTDADIN